MTLGFPKWKRQCTKDHTIQREKKTNYEEEKDEGEEKGVKELINEEEFLNVIRKISRKIRIFELLKKSMTLILM